MRRPRALRPGDEIRVVSPASPLDADQIADGVRLLEGAGYRISLGAHVFDRDGYLAGSDADRAADLQSAFADPTVAAVFCSRGGYGCARLIPHLDLDAIAASGKMFAGFSDVTTLHLALNRRGLVTMHTPMLLSFHWEREDWVKESFLRLLRGEDPLAVDAPRAETFRPGVAEGVLTGGCLCLLTDSLATPDPLEADGRILLIEDVDEDPHRVDAMLTHLRLAGIFDRVAGVIVGEMTNTDERSDPKIGAWPWRRIVEDRLADLSVPSVVGFPCGHMRAMLSLPLGVRVRLDADAGTLVLLEPPCDASA